MKKQIENRTENGTKQAATEYALCATGSGLYEIAVKDFALLATGEFRKVVLEASSRDEAKEIFNSLRGACTCKILDIRRIVNNIYWVE